MPYVVAYIAEILIAIGETAAVAEIVATVVVYAVVIGGSLAYSNYERQKAARAAGSLKNQGSPVLVRDATAPRILVYGIARLGGVIGYLQVTGASNEYIHVISLVAGCQLTSFDNIYFGSDKLAIDGSGNVTGCTDINGVSSTKYAGLARIKTYLGASSQTADGDLISESGGAWTTDHKLNGVAYIYMRLKWDTSAFPGGIPNLTCDVHGKAVYDPRTATTAWSANAALCAADWINLPTLGLNCPYSSIDATELNASANNCDELVTKADLTTEARYTINGVVASDSSPETILNLMANAMAGAFIYSGGVWYIQSGSYRASVLSFGEADIVGAVTMAPRLSRRDLCNAAKGLYVEPLQQWASVDFPPYQNSSYATQDNGVVIWHDLQFPLTTSGATAKRLAKIDVERTRRQIVVTFMVNLKGLQVRAGESILLTLPRYGWTNKEFEIVEWKLTTTTSGSDTASTPAVAMTLREIDSGVWTWANGEEGTYTFAAATTFPNPFNVAPPLGLILADDSYLQTGNGVFAPRLKCSWTTPQDQFVVSGGHIVVEYKRHTDSTWAEWSRIAGSRTYDYITDIQLGVAYDVRIKSVNTIGSESIYTEVDNHNVSSDTVAPATPTGLTAALGPGLAISLNWTANTEADLAGYKIYRGTSSSFGSASLIGKTTGTSFVDATVVIGTAYWYWIEAYDDFTNTSSPAASTPASLTATSSGLVVHAAPANPTAAALTASGFYSSGDGTVFSWLEITVPGKASDAQGVNLLYRASGDPAWLVAGQQLTGTALAIRITDFTPGVPYDIATQAFSSFEDFSGIVTATSSPFYTPNKNTSPSNLSSIAAHAPSSGYPLTPQFWGGTQVYGCTVTFTPPTDSDYVGAEWALSFPITGDVAPVGTGNAIPALATSFFYYDPVASLVAHLWTRTRNRSGIWTAWTNTGIDLTSYVALAAGNMSSQDSSAVAISGVQTGSGGSVRKILARYPFDTVVTLAGGSAEETFGITITGFTTKPDGTTGAINVSSDMTLSARYDWDDAGNSSTTAKVKISKKNGTNTVNGGVRIQGEFFQYL